MSKKSFMWNFFSPDRDSGIFATCNICKKKGILQNVDFKPKKAYDEDAPNNKSARNTDTGECFSSNN